MTVIHDETLRLLFCKIEKSHLEEKIEYHGNTLRYCGYALLACLIYPILFPLLQVLFTNHSFFWTLALFAILGSILLITCIAISAYIKLCKYMKYRKNHHKFISGYNRQL